MKTLNDPFPSLQDNPPPPPAPNTPPIRNSVVDDHEFLEKRLLEIKLKEQQKELEQDQRWLNEEASFPQLRHQSLAPTKPNASNGSGRSTFASRFFSGFPESSGNVALPVAITLMIQL